METLRKIIEEKKRKGEEKKPYYGIRKLSVGIVSCMLGHLLFFASPVVVSAVEATPEDVSIIQMQSVKGEAIERSATLVAVTGATGIRAASGNIDSENLGYAPNAKYSFQDLKFDPEKLSKTNSARQIQFKIYGKHNIAASTDNWKINLQILLDCRWLIGKNQYTLCQVSRLLNIVGDKQHCSACLFPQL